MKSQHVKEYCKRNLIYIIFSVIFLLLTLFDTAAFNIKLTYGDMPLDEYMYTGISGSMKTLRGDYQLSEENIKNNRFYTGIISSSQWTRNNNLLGFSLVNNNAHTSTIRLRNIAFRYLFLDLYTIDSENYSQILSSDQEISTGDNHELYIATSEKKALLSLETNQLIGLGRIKRKIFCVKVGIIVLLSAILLAFALIDRRSITRNSAYHAKWLIVLGIILCLVFCMSVFGAENASPDEKASAGSVKYYYTHWGLPDFGSADAKESIQNYGSSRLNEITPYYFLAGKTGALASSVFGYRTAYRVFNLLLFAVLIYFFARKGKNNKWLLSGIVFTPQLWYIFSYTTSDAWDYLLCFLIVVFVIIDDQIKRRYLFSVIRGVVFFLLLTGKRVFFAVILFAALIYLCQLIFKPEERKQLIREYAVMLLTAAILYGGRQLLDYIWYAGNKRTITREIIANNKQITIYKMIDKGYDLSYLITKTSFFTSLFHSFTGQYGWMIFESGEIYYFCIGIAYAGLLSYLLRHGLLVKNRMNYCHLIISFGTIIVAILIVLYHSWTYDYQPQGRYIFGSILCVMYLISRDKKVYEGMTVEYLMETIAMLSLFSFVRYGMVSIV